MYESDNTEVSNSFPLVPLQEPLLFSFSPCDSPDPFPAVSNFAGSLKIHSLGYPCSPYTDEETYSSQSLIKEMRQEEGFLPPLQLLLPMPQGSQDAHYSQDVELDIVYAFRFPKTLFSRSQQKCQSRACNPGS